MAGDIRGISIEIGGDTLPLQRALKEVNKETSKLQNELKYVDKALKLDPKNTDLIRQKQQLLAKTVEETKNKLDVLKNAERDAQEKMSQGIEINQEDYRRLQREIVETAEQLQNFETESNKVNTTFGQISSTFESAGNKLKDLGSQLTALSAVAGVATAGMVALGVKAGVSADDLNTLAKVTGLSTQELQAFKYAEDLIDVSTGTMAGALAKLTKNMANAKNGSKDQIEAFKELKVAFTDSTGHLRDNNDVFYEVINALGGIKNEAERDALAMKLFGKSAQELNPLILGGAEDLKKLTEEAKSYGVVLSQEVLDKSNAFNDKIDTLKARINGIGSIFGAKVAEALLPHMDSIVNFIGEIAKAISKLDPTIVTVVLAVGGLLAALAPVLTTIGQMSLGLAFLTGKMAIFGAGAVATGASATAGATGVTFLGMSFTSLLGPIALVVAAIVAIGLIVYGVVQNWDNIKNAVSGAFSAMGTTLSNMKDGVVDWANNTSQNIKNTVGEWKKGASEFAGNVKDKFVSGFEGLKKNASDKFQGIFDFFKSIWDKITGFFKKPLKFPTIERPKIPLPDISISGKFSLNPPQVPKISAGIKWYAQGGIFDAPSVIGVGEAGKEAVLPIDKLDGIMAKAIEKTGNTEVLIALLQEIKALRQDTKNMPYIQRTISRQGVI
jgi:phage tail tape measure protein, TP901 family|nr:MAG TPA: tail tape measure [Caudoviricetes sp.]